MLLEQVLFWDKVKRKPVKKRQYGQTVWKKQQQCSLIGK